VLFYGRYLPLHGVDTIVEAAAQLGARADVVLIGRGPERPRIEALARARGAAVTFRDEVPLTALPAELASASVVLGVFGAGRKAAWVGPKKLHRAAAGGGRRVTRAGPGLREALRPPDHCLVCPPAEPAALADAISTLLDDPRLAERLGNAARAHLLDCFAPERQAEHLGELLASRLGIAPPAPPSLGPAVARVT